MGDALVTHPGTVGVTFVGSSSVGEHVYKTAINHNKRAQCQGGAKNHVLIAEDAVIDEVMQNVVDSCFGHVGERCFAVSNVLVVERLYEKAKEKFIELTKKLVLGYGMDKGVTLGPVISRDALNGMLKEVDRAIKDGARLILDGRNPKVEKYPKGYFIGPTVFEAEPEMRIFQEEVFGPVRCFKKVSDLAEGVEIINRSFLWSYGQPLHGKRRMGPGICPPCPGGSGGDQHRDAGADCLFSGGREKDLHVRGHPGPRQ